jgi:hypothetical protein
MKKNGIILSAFSLIFLFVIYSAFANGEGHVIVNLSGESVKGNPCSGMIESTGIGKAPQGRSVAQARLLAERAAKVRAYRNLIRTVDRLSPILINGSGIDSATGFIRGAQVIEKNFFPDGRVEVKIAVNVHFLDSDSACEAWVTGKMRPYGLPVYKVDRTVEEIGEEDWVDLNT